MRSRQKQRSRLKKKSISTDLCTRSSADVGSFSKKLEKEHISGGDRGSKIFDTCVKDTEVEVAAEEIETQTEKKLPQELSLDPQSKGSDKVVPASSNCALGNGSEASLKKKWNCCFCQRSITRINNKISLVGSINKRDISKKGERNVCKQGNRDGNNSALREGKVEHREHRQSSRDPP